MRKLFRKVHLWLSIPLGIIISVICLSGAVLVFQDDVEEWSNPEKYYVGKIEGEPLPIGKLIKIVNSRLENNSVSSVRILSDPKRNYVMGLQEGSRTSVYVNPYTGDITGKSERGDGFFSLVQRLHRWLLGGKGAVGQLIVGYTTLFLVIILLSGIIVWWPKSRKQLKNRLQVKTKYGLKRFWLDLHTSGGAYLLIGLLILSLTGLYYSFDWYRKGLTGLLGIEMTEYHSQKQSGGKPEQSNSYKKETDSKYRGNPNQRGRNPNYRGSGDWDRAQNKPDELQKADSVKAINQKSSYNVFSSWQTVLDELAEKNPNFKSVTIQKGSASVGQNFTFGNIRASDRYTFDNETGKITKIQPYKDQDGATKLRGWIYSLHTGKWGGFLSKVLTCIIALTGGTLSFTGYYIFIIKHKGRKPPKDIVKKNGNV